MGNSAGTLLGCPELGNIVPIGADLVQDLGLASRLLAKDKVGVLGQSVSGDFGTPGIVADGLALGSVGLDTGAKKAHDF
jgi:hypothetical protein